MDAPVPARVWKGTALLFAGRVWSTACAAATLFLLARHLDLDEFGRYTFYITAFLLLDGLCDFGTGQVAVQQTAGHPERLAGVLKRLGRARASLGAVGWVFLAIGVLGLGEDQAGWILLAGLYPLTRSFEIKTVVYQNEVRWGVPVLVRSIAALLRLVAFLGLMQRGASSAPAFLVAHALVMAASNWTTGALASRRIPPSSQAPAKDLWKLAVPLGIATLGQQAYFYVDNFFVRAYAGEAEVGTYNAAVRLFTLSILFAGYATMSALPWLTRRGMDQDLSGSAQLFTRPIFLAAALGGGLFWPWTGPLLSLAFGPDFARGAEALRWLTLASLAVYAGSGFLTALVARGEMKAVIGLSIAGLLLNVLGNLALVPSHGMNGAAAATFATELFMAVGSIRALTRLEARPGTPLGTWGAGLLLFALAAGLSTLVGRFL